MRIEFNKQKVLVCDGAMGTMIYESGVELVSCPELLNESNPEVIRNIHKAYIDNGANIVETNTFGGSPLKLGEYGLANRAYDLCKIGAEIAKDAAGEQALVAGSVGSTGKLIAPMGEYSFEEVREAFQVQMQGLADGGVDLYLIETMMEITELKAAYLAARDVAPHIPVICQMTYTDCGATVMGTTPEIAASVMEGMGADYIGVNCSTGPAGLLPVVKRMHKVTNVPLTVQPNAGLPEMENDQAVYRETPETMALFVSEFVKAGAKIVGGCCGTTPEHIKAIAAASAECVYVDSNEEKPVSLCSRRVRKVLGEEQIKAASLEAGEEVLGLCQAGDSKRLTKIFRKQIKSGANCLYIALPESYLCEELATQLMLGLNGPLNLPLVLSTASGEYLEKFLMLASGNALIGDVHIENFDAMLALAKRYGAGLALRPRNEKEFSFCEEQIEKAVSEKIARGLLLIDISDLVAKEGDTTWFAKAKAKSRYIMLHLDSLSEDISNISDAELVIADFREERFQGI